MAGHGGLAAIAGLGRKQRSRQLALVRRNRVLRTGAALGSLAGAEQCNERAELHRRQSQRCRGGQVVGRGAGRCAGMEVERDLGKCSWLKVRSWRTERWGGPARSGRRHPPCGSGKAVRNGSGTARESWLEGGGERRRTFAVGLRAVFDYRVIRQ